MNLTRPAVDSLVAIHNLIVAICHPETRSRSQEFDGFYLLPTEYLGPVWLRRPYSVPGILPYCVCILLHVAWVLFNQATECVRPVMAIWWEYSVEGITRDFDVRDAAAVIGLIEIQFQFTTTLKV
ncbi:hypothetical protein BO71DRAFT_427796 [Aspergillus ellipticus CBS 707.79]|uniref:Uncharacterized protein n=1 Tax=Aspergillus ellipticus CBS 707.79 TaxID=1448320 RepID=A0A319DRL9_9EURO|nr:hypothetical protein BO71DRAFT_427796 [Aspergillus ellipticus CBS 707.79]